MTRLQPRCPENAHFLDYVRISYLLRCRKALPQSVLDKSWLTPPAALEEVSLSNAKRQVKVTDSFLNHFSD